MSSLRVPVVLVFLSIAGCAAPPAGSKVTGPSLPEWLRERRDLQIAAAARSAVLHDFRFTDRIQESGISFVNRFVEDVARAYKHVHYDHGNGLCTADVDGDGQPDLYFVTQLGTNELWRNLGEGRFENITDQAGVGMPDAIGVGCAFADINNDGKPDLFVTTVRHGNHLFENLGAGRFRDITARAGVGYAGHSSGAVFFDYDGDGLLDLFVTNVGAYTSDTRGPGGYYVGLTDAFHGHVHPERAEASILYRNVGENRFQDVSRETGLIDKSWSGDATALDLNSDGRPDLYILNMLGSNHLWLNQGSSHFRDASAQYLPRTPWGAMGVKVFDFNGDGQLDLFVTDMHSDMWDNIPGRDWAAETRKSDSASPRMSPGDFPEGKKPFIFGNALFANHGNRFAEVSDSLGVETYWPWGPSVDDLNADGWDDSFIASGMNFPFRYAVNPVLLNEAGSHFLRSEFVLGIEPRKGGTTEQLWFTLDCRGTDRENALCVACLGAESAHPRCSHHDQQGHFTMMSALGSRSSAILDLDGDGDLDIVTNEFGAAPQVLVSDLAQTHRIHPLRVVLRGTRSNRQGIGARVAVILPGGRQILKLMDGKSGYLSQSDLPLYFGLADADHAASIEVVWPSGRRSRVRGPIPAGQVIEVVEP